MSPHSRPTAEEIARRAQELKLVHLGLHAILFATVDPRLPLLQWELERNGSPPNGDYPILVGHQPNEGGIEYSAREVFTKLAALRGDVLFRDLMSIAMVQGGIRLGDMIRKGNHSRSDVPLLQFARHFRNACAHGDKWDFQPGQPRHPAACRELVLTADLNGERATFQTVSPRRYIEFLDDISNYFVPGFAPPPT